MKFFIDTADVKEIAAASELGLVDGVTTNPSLVAKSGRDFHEVLKEIIALVDGPISAEVVATDTAGMIGEAEELAKLDKDKTKALSKKGYKTNLTLIFSPLQALLAAKAGATFVSPFVGRLDDIGHQGMEVVDQIRTIFDNYGYSTEIIVASIRSPQHVLEAGLMGADICTIPFSVMQQLAKHPLTDIGLEKFLTDWKKHVEG
jgi:transaldolase